MPFSRNLLTKLSFGPAGRELAEVERLGPDAWLGHQLRPGPDDGCGPRIEAVKWRLKYKYAAPAAVMSGPAPMASQASPQQGMILQTAPSPETMMKPGGPPRHVALMETVIDQAHAAPPNPAPVPMIEVDEERSARVIEGPIEQHWKTIAENQPNQERQFLRTAVAAATLIRAVHSPWQVREVMTDFWHNHFNVHAVDAVAVALPTYDRDCIRAHALGNFRELLEAVAQSAAMQIYLNNRSSRGGAANENYARELFELHTLGRPAYFNALYNRWRDVPGAIAGKPIGYIDQDVYEAARAFTGWTIEDGAGIGGGQKLPQTGKFVFVEGFHDNYQKRVLAAEFDPYQKPMADGRRVLDILSAHPATHRYVCEKLCRRLVADTPPLALIERAAKVFGEALKAPDQIARTVEVIARSDEFATSAGAKVKRPLELVASFARATDSDLTVTPGLLGELDNSGQRLFGWAPPTGHPDTAAYWTSSAAMLRRWGLVLGLANDAWKAGPPVIAGTVAHESTAGAALDRAHLALLGEPASPATRSAILGGLGIEPGAPFAPRNDAIPAARQLLAFCAMTPAYQLR